MKRLVPFFALMVAACSGSASSPEHQRVAALEQENLKLQGELKEARDNVAKLQAAMGRSSSVAEDSVAEVPGAAVVPEPANPLPGGGDAGGAASTVHKE